MKNNLYKTKSFLFTFLTLIIISIISFYVFFFYDEGTFQNVLIGETSKFISYILCFPSLVWNIFLKINLGYWFILGVLVNIFIYSLIISYLIERKSKHA
jgi:hypothetical protein